MTDTEILTQIQYALVETPNGGASVPSALWTVDELTQAINSAQQWVMRDAQPLFARTTLVTVPNEGRYTLPQSWLMTRRVAWKRADGAMNQLPRDSSWSADQLQSDWSYNYAAEPVCYTDFDPPFVALQVMPASVDNGVLHITFVPLPATLSNTGIAWTIPDILIPMAKWKAVSILLSKDGRGQDLPRAMTAAKLAEAGLTAVTLLLNGWR